MMPILFRPGERLSCHLTEVRCMFFTHLRHRIVTGVSVAALTAGLGVAAIGGSHGATIGPPPLEWRATAFKPAIRLSQTGTLIFPMNPLPKCALSKSSFGQPRP